MCVTCKIYVIPRVEVITFFFSPGSEMSLAVDDSSFGALQDLGLIDHQGRPICAPDLVPKLLNLQKDHTGPGARNDLNPHVSKFLRMIVSGLSAFGEKTSRDGYLALTIVSRYKIIGATRRLKLGTALLF